MPFRNGSLNPALSSKRSHCDVLHKDIRGQRDRSDERRAENLRCAPIQLARMDSGVGRLAIFHKILFRRGSLLSTLRYSQQPVKIEKSRFRGEVAEPG